MHYYKKNLQFTGLGNFTFLIVFRFSKKKIFKSWSKIALKKYWIIIPTQLLKLNSSGKEEKTPQNKNWAAQEQWTILAPPPSITTVPLNLQVQIQMEYNLPLTE